MCDYKEKYLTYKSYIEEQRIHFITSKWQNIFQNLEKLKYHTSRFIRQNELLIDEKEEIILDYLSKSDELGSELRYFWPKPEKADHSYLALIQMYENKLRLLEEKGLRIKIKHSHGIAYLLPHNLYMCNCPDL